MYCSYKDCPNVARPYSSITFFSLPNDHRRELWITNSSNESLRTVKPQHKRVICENHFLERDLRRQFNRTILRRDAIPLPYQICTTTSEIDPLEERTPEIVILSDNLMVNSKCTNDHTETQEEEEDIIYYDVFEDGESNRLPDDDNHVHDPETVDEQSNSDIDTTILEDLEYLNAEDEPNVRETDNTNINDRETQLISAPRLLTSSNTIQFEDNEVPSIKKSRLELNINTSHSANIAKLARTAINLKEMTTTSTVADIIAPTKDDANNEDIYFVLSLSEIFKRLPPQKRALAKCNILRYLTELEYGSSADL